MKKIHRFIEISRKEGIEESISRTKKYLTKYLSGIYPYFPEHFRVEQLKLGKYSVTLEVGPHTGSHGFENERGNINRFLDELDENDIVFDIGANVGLYSCFAGKKCTQGEIYSFEPYPPNIKQLNKNINYSRLENIIVVNVALSDENGITEFSAPSSGSVGFKTGSLGQGPTTGQNIDVQQKKGDDLVDQGIIPQPNIVKIDVEGAEAAVYRGLKDTLSAEECRSVFCEIHPKGHHPNTTSIEDFGMTPIDLIQSLEEMGFSLEYKHDRNSQIHIKMIK